MFRRLAILSALACSFAATAVQALNATSISSCPALAKRTAPTKVTNLRPDDIKVVAAMGDSIMAGFAMMGIDPEGTGILNFSALTEYRGNSYGIGGDSDAVTLATFVKHYSPNVQGASRGNGLVSFCNGDFCPGAWTYNYLVDRLNAAISGSIAQNLDVQLDYLIRRMKSASGIDFQNDWKMITIQIGSNDQCASCSNPDAVTAEKYGKYVSDAVARIKASVPRVIVNLLGVFKVSPVYTISTGQSYCRPVGNDSSTILNRQECSCFQGSEQNRTDMDRLAEAYNEQLVNIYNSYKNNQSDTFAVAYQPANIDINTFPIDALSNFDCFHPSLKAHQWVAKTFWNNLFIPPAQKPTEITWDENLEIYCPTEDDRIQI